MTEAADIVQNLRVTEPLRTYTEPDADGICTDDRGQSCIDVKRITVLTGRGRTDFGPILELARSIKELGLIQPIHLVKLDGQNVLVAGERRFRAFLFTGQRFIPFTWGNNDELYAKEAELEENVNRQDLSTLEQIELTRQIHELKVKKYGENLKQVQHGWTIGDTAKLMGKGVEQTRVRVNVGKKLKKRPELVAAVGHLPLTQMVKQIERIELAEQYKQQVDLGAVKASANLLQGSCLDHVSKLADRSVNLWLSDPPFGNPAIKQDKSDNNVLSYTSVLKAADNMDPASFREMMSKLVPIMAPKLKVGAHVYLFFAFDHYQFLVDLLLANGIYPDLEPIIWDKERTTSPFMGYSWPMSYEPILFAHNIERATRLVKPGRNIIRCGVVESKLRKHSFHKPAKLISQLIGESTREGDLVVDTFAGSGEVLKTALSMGRNAWGCELDMEHWATAQQYLGSQVPETGKPKVGA